MLSINAFKIYNKHKLLVSFYKSIAITYAIVGLYLIYKILISEDNIFYFFALIFMCVTIILSLNNRFQNHSFSVIFTIFTFLFIAIPIFFISYMGSDFIAGGSVGEIPMSQIEYQENLGSGMFFLTICWISVWLGIISLKCNLEAPARFISLRGLIFLGIIVAYATIENSLSIILGRVEGTDPGVSILALLFFDHSYLVLTGTLVFFYINGDYKECIEKNYLNNSINLIFVIYFIFSVIGFISGSKASILVTFILLIFLPLSLSVGYEFKKVIFIKLGHLLLLFLITPFLFLLALINRINEYYGNNNLSLYNIIISFDVFCNEMYLLFESIFYRLTWGGLDQYFLLHYTFIRNGEDDMVRSDFLVYLTKNMINLILPGTPFPEAYAPSSQLFLAVINKINLYSNYDAISLAISNNTQPYTIFGIFILIFGLFTPFILYAYTIIIAFLYNASNNFILKIVILYFFHGMLSSYGFEVAIGNSVLFFIGLIAMYMPLKLFNNK